MYDVAEMPLGVRVVERPSAVEQEGDAVEVEKRVSDEAVTSATLPPSVAGLNHTVSSGEGVKFSVNSPVLLLKLELLSVRTSAPLSTLPAMVRSNGRQRVFHLPSL